MFYLYYEDKNRDLVPVMDGDKIKEYMDAQDCAQAAEGIESLNFEINSDEHSRSMRGVRLGRETVWRVNGKSGRPVNRYRKIGETL